MIKNTPSASNKGHLGCIYSIIITPDEEKFISGGDFAIKIWELESGTCLNTLKEHGEFVTSLAITPDGKRFISGSGDGTIKSWDVKTGRCLRTLEGHQGILNTVVITPDGKTIVSGGTDPTIKLWDLQSGECIQTVKGQPLQFPSGVTSMVISPSGEQIITASNAIRIWDRASGTCMMTFEHGPTYPNSIAVTPNGNKLVSAECEEVEVDYRIEFKNHCIKIWDAKSGSCVKTLRGHADMINTVIVTSDGKKVISGSIDHTMRMWDLETGECLRTFEDQQAWTYVAIAITADGKMIISNSGEGADRGDSLKIWDAETGECVKTLSGQLDIE